MPSNIAHYTGHRTPPRRFSSDVHRVPRINPTGGHCAERTEIRASAI